MEKTSQSFITTEFDNLSYSWVVKVIDGSAVTSKDISYNDADTKLVTIDEIINIAGGATVETHLVDLDSVAIGAILEMAAVGNEYGFIKPVTRKPLIFFSQGENQKWLLKALEDDPYVFRNITPTGSTIPRLQDVEDLQGDDLLYYDAEMELVNMILLSIPNEIYNSVDSCKTDKEMWDRVERLMRRTIQNQVDRETRFTNEFDQFVAKPGESLVSVYNRFAQLMNDLERNNMKFPTVLVNTKFLNSLQPEWLKYKLVNASRAKKLEKSHDPLDLVAHTGSSSRNTSSYVTHPSSVVDYDEEYEQDDVYNHSKDPLASAMLLLAKAITQNFSNPTNNHLCASSNTRNQAVVQGDSVNIQSRNAADQNSDDEPSYESAFVSEVQSSSINENDEPMYPTHTKIINSTIDDDQINSNIQFDSVKGNVNSGSVEKDTHVYDRCALETLARNAYDEAAKQQRFAQKVQEQNMTLTSQIEMYKERNRVLENITKDNNYLKEFLEADERAKRVQKQAESQLYRDRDIIRDLEKQRDKLSQEVKHFKQKNEELQQSHLILKRKMSENEDKYHDTILDLEEKLKKNVDLFLKIGNSLQAMFMLDPKPLSVYDQQLKHGLGYPNPYTLRQPISECPKLYVASRTGNIEIPLNVKDSEETLEDALKSQQKMNEKMNDPIGVANKQNYSGNKSNANKRASMFYTSKEEIALNDFCRDQVKPLLNELLDYFDGFQNLFQMDIKEMKDAFEQNDVYLDEIKRQNDLLKDQLLEASLKHDIELCVLLNHECVDKSLHDELEQVKKKSLEIQEGLKARIKILEKDVQRCEKQSVDFELKLQHEKEKHKWDSSKNKNSKPLDFSWISRIQKLEDENVSLDFKVQSLIKERDNAKMEYKKLFDSIKKTRSQTQKEMDELIAHVSEKTYAYGAIRAENQNLLDCYPWLCFPKPDSFPYTSQSDWSKSHFVVGPSEQIFVVLQLHHMHS
ncbi:hypothetical protein Tco_0923591 [Tanacetum coccineum]|uniref:Uncharacterized protein n=1 Tax=Tanacetum coccineum TaxID=301880 RepID=A0ABQ5D2V0_9ASTR